MVFKHASLKYMYIHLFQTAFYQSGLKSVFSKIFGERMSLRNTPWGEEPMSDIIKHLMTPLTRGHVDFGSIADELTTIIEKVSIIFVIPTFFSHIDDMNF